jgi:hypothetical protein
MRKISEKILSPARDLNPEPPEFEPARLPRIYGAGFASYGFF